jgi:phosphatidate cytidylyltransferase
MITTNIKKRIYTSLMLLLLIILISSSNAILVFGLIVLGVLSLLEFINLSNKIIKNKFYLLISNFFFVVYIFIFCLMFLYFSNFFHLKIIIFSLLLSCVASDIGGFVFGKTFKGRKITKISPNKTYAGSIGSVIFSMVVFSGSIFFFTNNFSYIILIIAIITSIACQFGDLFFSFLKRKAKIKDTGNFLPGHGGILDRLDGIFLGMPIGFISLIIFY